MIHTELMQEATAISHVSPFRHFQNPFQWGSSSADYKTVVSFSVAPIVPDSYFKKKNKKDIAQKSASQHELNKNSYFHVLVSASI